MPGGIEVIAASDTHLDALVDTHSTAPKAAQRRPSMPAPIPEPAPVAEVAAQAPAEPQVQAVAQADTSATPNALARLRNRFTAARRAAVQAPVQEDALAEPAAGRKLQARVDDDVELGASETLLGVDPLVADQV